MRIRSIAALVGLVALVAACSAGPGTGGELQGTKWILRSYDNAGTLTLVPDNEYADIEFDFEPGHRLQRLQHVQRAVPRRRPDAVHQRAGVDTHGLPPEAMALEQAYLQLLDGSRFYSARGDTLTIFDSIGSTSLVFDAAPRNPLLGKWQVDSFETKPNTVSILLPGTTIDVAFGIGSVGGFSGCNSFSGTYGTNGNVVRIGRLATTRLACPDDVMAQETAFLQALEGASLIETRNNQVNLTDLGGSLKVALLRPTPEIAPSPEPQPSAPASEAPSVAPSAGGEPVAHPRPHPDTRSNAETDTAPDRAAGVRGAAQPAALHPADGRVLRPEEPGWHVRRPGRVSRRLAHGRRARQPRLPVFRPERDHGARRSGDADKRDPRVRAATGLRRRGHRGDESGSLDRPVADADDDRQSRGDADRRDVEQRRGRHPDRHVSDHLIVNVGSSGSVSMWTSGAATDQAFKDNSAILSLMVASTSFTAGP